MALLASTRFAKIGVRWIPLFLNFIWLSLLSPHLLAQESTKADRNPLNEETKQRPMLEIQFESEFINSGGLREQYGWLDVCANLSQYFRRNGGLMGTGPFFEIYCVDQGKHYITSHQPMTSKKESNKIITSEIATPSPAMWHLKIQELENNLTFEISFKHGTVVESVTSLSLENVRNPINRLADRTTQKLIAAHLVTGLPMRSLVPANKVKVDEVLSGMPVTNLNIKPPKSLLYFDMFRDNDIWKASLVGKATLVEQSPKPSLGWKATNVAKNLSKKFYFAQMIGSRTKMQEQIRELIIQRVEETQAYEFRLERTYAFGLRHGTPVLGEKSAINSASMYGLFIESRSGPLAGLSMSYDLVQNAKFETDLYVESFGWSRIQLGYGLGTKISFAGFNWVDLTPRIGLTNLQYSLVPISEDSGIDTVAFEILKAPTGGLEIGLERRAQSFLVRTWASGNSSLGVSKTDKNISTKSYRLGLDLHKDFYTRGSFRFGGLAFGSYDYLSITRQVADDGDDDSVAVTDILFLNLSAIYVGLGLTVWW